MVVHSEPQQDKLGNAGVREALDRVLNHAHFVAAPRLASFLKFIVETTLEGNARLIKAYTIATMALDRPESFDPAADAIVRVEANRLRNALARYYASDGANDMIMIKLPRGSYVPKFFCRYASERVEDHWPYNGSARPAVKAGWAKMLIDMSISNDERMLEVVIDECRHWIGELVSNLTQIQDELTNARTAIAVSNRVIRIEGDGQKSHCQTTALPLSQGSSTCPCGRRNCLSKNTAFAGELTRCATSPAVQGGEG